MIESGDDVEQRGFAATGGTFYREELARMDEKAYAVECPDFGLSAEDATDSSQLEQLSADLDLVVDTKRADLIRQNRCGSV